jgi:hypothetical protein
MLPQTQIADTSRKTTCARRPTPRPQQHALFSSRRANGDGKVRAGHARLNACLGFSFSLGAKFFRCSRWGDQLRFLSLPYWAGSSTLALGPGCCGFVGPVPSATLDKRCREGSDSLVAKQEIHVKQFPGQLVTHFGDPGSRCSGTRARSGVRDVVPLRLPPDEDGTNPAPRGGALPQIESVPQDRRQMNFVPRLSSRNRTTYRGDCGARTSTTEVSFWRREILQ